MLENLTWYFTAGPITRSPFTTYPLCLTWALISFNVVREKHKIILNKTGAHLLGGRLVFLRRSNGSSLRATRVLPGGHADASTALATFADLPSHHSDGPPSPVQYRSATSPVVHKKYRMSSSCRTSNAGAENGGKSFGISWGKGKESESVLSGNDGMAAAVLSPGGVFINKKKIVVDINHFHVSLAHAHSCVLKVTARKPDIQLVGELVPCSGYSMAKGIRASTPHRTTSRAAAPLDMVHIDTAGPFPESLGGSRYVVMFVDSASRFQRPYGTRDKSASAILGVVQRFVVDMGVPRAFRTDSGTEYTNSAFVEYCNSLQIRRELTALYTPQQNGPVESGLSRAIKAGHAACIEVNKLFSGVTWNASKEFGTQTARVYGWSLSYGLRKGSTAPRPRRTAACSPRMRYFTGAARRCRSCRSASRRTIASHGTANWTAKRARVIFSILNTTTGAIASRLWTRKPGGSCTRATSFGTSRGNR